MCIDGHIEDQRYVRTQKSRSRPMLDIIMILFIVHTFHTRSRTVMQWGASQLSINSHVSLKYDTNCALLQSVEDEFFIEMNGHVSRIREK